MSACIVHICPRSDWERARQEGVYRPASLESEGFIHFSRPEQVAAVANRFYAGRTDLLLLWVPPQNLTAPLKWEAADGEIFPHLYGALPVEAVAAVTPFQPGERGLFRRAERPAGSTSLC